MPNIRFILFRFIIKLFTIVTITLGVLLSPLPLIFLYVWKSIVNSLAFIFRRDLSPMKSMDYSMVIYGDNSIEDPKSKNFNGNVGITCKLNGKVDGETFFQKFDKKVIGIDDSKDIDPNHNHIRFYRSIQRFCGYWFFKTFQNKLKYEDHVTCTTLKDNNSFEEEICKWLKVRYNVKKCPLWGILLIYREDSHDTIFAFKIHHLLADGYSLLHILDLLTNTNRKYQVQNFQETKWEKVWTKSCYSCIQYYINAWIFVPKSPIHQRNDDDIFLTHVSVPLNAIKEIRKKAQVRFQSVMLSSIVNYINSVIIETVEDEEKIPDKIIICKSLPWPNHPQIELCNHLTIGVFPFKIRSKNNPYQESLSDVNNTFESYHERRYDRVTYHLGKPFKLIPVQLLKPFMYYRRTRHDNISCYYAHLIGSEEYSNVFNIKCRDVNLFAVPTNQKCLHIFGVTISDEIRLSIMGPKYLFASQEQADKFSNDNFQLYITKLIENTYTVNKMPQ